MLLYISMNVLSIFTLQAGLSRALGLLVEATNIAKESEWYTLFYWYRFMIH